MLKIDLPVKAPSIWVEIESLRDNRLEHLAPKMQDRVLILIHDCKKISTVNGEVFDPIVFETARPQRLQEIYYQQGTTNAPTAIYGWHFYGLAIDVISKSKQWSVKPTWWAMLARLMRMNKIDPGYDWFKKDEPHGQFGGLKKSPSDLARTLYFGTPYWNDMRPFTDPAAHRQGLERVWRAVGAM